MEADPDSQPMSAFDLGEPAIPIDAKIPHALGPDRDSQGMMPGASPLLQAALDMLSSSIRNDSEAVVEPSLKKARTGEAQINKENLPPEGLAQ